MTELKLEVGKTYLDRLDNEVLIIGTSSNEYFPMQSATHTYRLNGRLYATSGEDCGDLISEYIEPAQPAARTPRPHAQLRKDFADGWDIEFFSLTYGKWVMCNSEPGWHPDVQFRRKPEPLKPNSTVFLGILDNGFGSYAYETGRELKNTGCLKALRIEWNLNTQELVSASVVTL